MSKHGHARKRRSQAAPPGQMGDPARPRASAGSRPSATSVPDDPASPGESSIGSSPTHEQIAMRAYDRWEARGRMDGADREDWFEAERQLRGLAEAE